MNKKNDGCIYTKRWVVKLILDLCGYTSDKQLVDMTLVEPSCGDGSFIIEVIERLCKSFVDNKRKEDELKKCILAYDINVDAIDLVRKKAEEVLQAYGISKDTIDYLLNTWFIADDFITADIQDADFVVGNPPYIRATDISNTTREEYSAKLSSFTFGTDMYIAFIEKGLRILNANGKLCYICSDRWQKNQSGQKIREYLKNNGYHISFNCQMHDVDAFETSVTAYPAITIIEQKAGYEIGIICNEYFNENQAKNLLDRLSKNNYSPSETFTFNRINVSDPYSNFPTLEESGVFLGIGIATGKDAVFITDDASIVESERLIPLAYARDIKDNKFPTEPIKWLINPWDNGNLVELDRYPKLKDYFYSHADELKSRHVAKTKKDSNRWYRTIDKLKDNLQQQKKLLIRDLSHFIEPIYEEGVYYPHHNLYWMTSDVWDLEVLGGILISNVVNEMMVNNSVKMRGGVIRNQAQYLKKIRVPYYDLISDEDRALLTTAFRTRNRDMATKICERLYK